MAEGNLSGHGSLVLRFDVQCVFRLFSLQGGEINLSTPQCSNENPNFNFNKQFVCVSKVVLAHRTSYIVAKHIAMYKMQHCRKNLGILRGHDENSVVDIFFIIGRRGCNPT